MKHKLILSDNKVCHYEMVQSSRAKIIRLKISPTGEVKVVVPQRINNKKAHDFVKEKKVWIDKVLKAIADTPIPEIVIPTVLNLQAINQSWQVNYSPTDYDGVMLTPETGSLLVEGLVNDKPLVFNVLEKWLKIKAKQIFPGILDDIATTHGFVYNCVTIRGQKTRWGSCSSKKNINLNYKLLFFPEAVMRYVFIHELCHTQEMNHSRQFWALVEQCDADYQQHRLVLKNTAEFIPYGL